MQDGMKMGSAKSGYQGRDRSGMQGNGAYGEVGREEYGEGGREEYRGRGREQYGYHEIKEHAGRDFPFNIYPCSIPADFRQVPVHWHEDMEIIAVKKGRGVVTVDMEPYEAGAGEAVVVFPGQLHGISQCGSEAMEYENIIFLPSMLMSAESDLCTYDFLRPMTEGGIGKPLHITGGLPDYGAFMECIGILDQLCGKKNYAYQMGVKGTLFWFLGLIAGIWGPGAAGQPRKSRERMKRLLEYMEEHYGEKITVEDGAELCFYSNSHFMKYFKQYMGVPFIQYLNEFRLEKAAGMLLTTPDPVTAVAQRCGFDNISYFNRLFRRKYGKTPGEYRKNGEIYL